jgi:hypothetical protein
VATNLQIESPNFDRIRKGDTHATEDAVRLLWLVANNEISMRQQTVQQASDQWSPKVLASPASSQQDNFDARDSVWIVFTSPTAFTVTGIRNGVEGRTLLIENLGTGAVTLAYEHAASDALNRFYTRLGTDHVLQTGQTALVGYLHQRWRVSSPVASPDASSGFVVGPASATDNAVVRYDTTTGKLVQNSGVLIDDSANLYVPGNLRERGRATPLGEWTDVAASASYFAVGGAGGGNWDPGTVSTFAYTLIGKTLHLQVYVTGGTWYTGGALLAVALPAGLTAARYCKGSAFITAAGMAYETCMAYAFPSSGWLNIYRAGLAAFPAAASVSMFLEMTASLS